MPVLIRELGRNIFEYLFVFRGQLYGNWFELTGENKAVLARKLKKGETLSSVLLVCSSAEGHIDQIKKLKSWWWRHFWRRFEPKIENE